MLSALRLRSSYWKGCVMPNSFNKLRKLAKKATPGKWSHNINGTCDYVESPSDHPNATWMICYATKANSKYIAAANPETLIELLNLLKFQHEALKKEACLNPKTCLSTTILAINYYREMGHSGVYPASMNQSLEKISIPAGGESCLISTP